jgi:hypothetical protein
MTGRDLDRLVNRITIKFAIVLVIVTSGGEKWLYHQE